MTISSIPRSRPAAAHPEDADHGTANAIPIKGMPHPTLVSLVRLLARRTAAEYLRNCQLAAMPQEQFDDPSDDR